MDWVIPDISGVTEGERQATGGTATIKEYVDQARKSGAIFAGK